MDLLNWKVLELPSTDVHAAVQEVDWNKLCKLASRLNNDLACVPLDKVTNGLHNVVRLIEFSDQTRWIARVSLRTSAAKELQSEVNVMEVLHYRTSLPVPRIFAYEVNEANPIGVPFILMEFIEGNTAMDSAGGFEAHRGIIPLEHRPNFYRSVARCHVQITNVRFSKIGTVIKQPNGEYDIGPLPILGGPFSTAKDFFNAWAAHAKFPRSRDDLSRLLQGGLANEVWQGIIDFPSQTKAIADRLASRYSSNYGPFPLCHRDFLHSNIIINKDWEALSVIDWEGACTLPLELAAFPAFLKLAPAEFGSSGDYDGNGVPTDEEDKQRWTERQSYIQMVKSAQDDDVLSTCLGNEVLQALSHLIGAYENGKWGFYHKALEKLRD